MKQYDYKKNIFGFEFPESQEVKKETKCETCKKHEIDESSWQTENFPR